MREAPWKPSFYIFQNLEISTEGKTFVKDLRLGFCGLAGDLYVDNWTLAAEFISQVKCCHWRIKDFELVIFRVCHIDIKFSCWILRLSRISNTNIFISVYRRKSTQFTYCHFCLTMHEEKRVLEAKLKSKKLFMEKECKE